MKSYLSEEEVKTFVSYQEGLEHDIDITDGDINI